MHTQIDNIFTKGLLMNWREIYQDKLCSPKDAAMQTTPLTQHFLNGVFSMRGITGSDAGTSLKTMLQRTEMVQLFQYLPKQNYTTKDIIHTII